MSKQYMQPNEAFIHFLENTLIPDLITSGDLYCSRTLKRAVRYMKGTLVKDKDAFIEDLTQLEKEYRERGRDCTADDFRTCIGIIYWTNKYEQ